MRNPTAILLGLVLFMLSGCISTRMGEKGAYVEQDKVYTSVKRLTGVSIISIARAGDEAMYQAICSQIQISLTNKGIPSDIRSLKEFDGEAALTQAMQAVKQPVVLRINPIQSNTLRDEMNNPFYVNQAIVTIQQPNGEKWADFAIRIDKDGRSSTLAKEIASAITKYLSKSGWIK